MVGRMRMDSSIVKKLLAGYNKSMVSRSLSNIVSVLPHLYSSQFESAPFQANFTLAFLHYLGLINCWF